MRSQYQIFWGGHCSCGVWINQRVLPLPFAWWQVETNLSVPFPLSLEDWIILNGCLWVSALSLQSKPFGPTPHLFPLQTTIAYQAPIFWMRFHRWVFLTYPCVSNDACRYERCMMFVRLKLIHFQQFVGNTTLTGTIPTSIAFSQLTYLDLCRYSRVFVADLELCDIQHIFLLINPAMNGVLGTIPEDIFYLTNLRYLNLGERIIHEIKLHPPTPLSPSVSHKFRYNTGSNRFLAGILPFDVAFATRLEELHLCKSFSRLNISLKRVATI